MRPPPPPPPRESLLHITDLTILRPDGQKLLSSIDLDLRRGEIVALLGASGAGKSTLLAAIQDASALRTSGFDVRFDALEARTPPGFVPQRGALFEHLSAAGNIELARRNAAGGESKEGSVLSWLERLHLPPEWASSNVEGQHLSGGEAQRLAVARTLASGRQLLFLDEPSVGLDPYRVRVLASLLRSVIHSRGAGAIVITHDLAFAAAFADTFLYMDRASHSLARLDLGCSTRRTERSEEDRARLEAALTIQTISRLKREALPSAVAHTSSTISALRERVDDFAAPLAVAPQVLVSLPSALTARFRDFTEVIGVVLKQTLLRPIPFFAIASALIGYSVLYIFHRSFASGELPLRDAKVLEIIGARHIIALVPPLSGVLFTATSGNALVAWLGGISLTRQSTALRSLGIPEQRYLWVPAWIGLVTSYTLLAGLFTVGMILGSALYVYGIDGLGSDWSTALDIVTAQLIDPRVEESSLLVRGKLLIVIYALGIAADSIAKGAKTKTKAEAITVSMVRNVMTCTLWIVLLELISLPFVLR